MAAPKPQSLLLLVLLLIAAAAGATRPLSKSPTDLAVDSINKALAKIDEGLGALAKLKASDAAKGPVDTCKQAFGAASDELKRVAEKLKRPAPESDSSVNTFEDGALTNLATCRDSFEEVGLDFPIREIGEELTALLVESSVLVNGLTQ